MGTRRQQITRILTTRPATVRELAGALGVRMAEIIEDLGHIQRSLGGRLVVGDSECEACGHVLRRERRFTAPSRCPRCRSERTSEPLLSVRAEE